FLDGPLPQSPQAAWARGVAYVPQERRTEGLMMAMGVRPNALLPHLDGVFAKLRQERRLVRSLAEDVRLKAEGPEQPVWQLSGGNQQKVLFARALAGQPKLLLLDEPTRGVDVAARFEIYSLIKERVGQGCACLVASSDLQELLTLSDRILILHGGHHGGILDTAALTTETLLTMLYQHESLSR
ncbi:MAG: ATP-binding cassette domain-containing protein, partial [Pseudomonadota bacterium]